ncbi:glycosyl transferase group 1 [Rippkaea orientalis PCC 8801]|uniref:Glycosyl transferase group 1 n=1 Tax=Rippkaea orientalis (strain PCC 8801 / RF-1) TaxID=41431 RepID=B7K6E2_RIPO1|nr:glycosyltransferase family 4 protein [Rippkaea orientalis]ACK68195.1 glycosyl transferase group 1 [Rippkaea orientalis PCC 8801]
MRIAYICADRGIPVFGQKGCSIHVQEVIRGFLKQKAEVHLFTPRIDDNSPEDLAEVKLHALLPIPKVNQEIREKMALSTNAQIESELEWLDPFDFVYERYSLWSYSAMEYAQRKGIPGILEVNAPLILEQRQHRGLVHLEEAETVAKRVFNAATVIIAVSENIKDYLTQYVKDTNKIKVIPNGVNPHRFIPKMDNNPSSSEFTIGFVGSLKPWHGLPILIEAFAQFHNNYPHSKLLIIGDGPERDRLLHEITHKNLQSVVELTGAVSPHLIPSLLTQIDVAVAPYPPMENFYFSPLKVYEYMIAGLPVVASRIGQLSELIEDGSNGLLCPPGDVNALATALEQLWRSPELRYQLGTQARQTILANYTWDQVVQRILQLAEHSRNRHLLVS